MKRYIIFVIAFIVVIFAITVSYLLFTGPRMFVQPNIRHFQAVMPVTPANTIPVEYVIKPVPSKEEAKKLVNPLDANEQNIAKGRVYYGYYCAFCHGQKGDGYGPVGFSYVPVPSDLRTQKVKAMTDGEVLYSMLTGTGHALMMEQIIPAEFRWYLVLYVRQIDSDSQASH